MFQNLGKYISNSTPFAPKLSYLFLIAFVVIFAGGSSILYFRSLPDSITQEMTSEQDDPFFMASQTLHSYDHFLVSLNLFQRNILKKSELDERYSSLLNYLKNYERNIYFKQEVAASPRTQKYFNNLKQALKDLNPTVVNLSANSQKDFDMIYETLIPFEMTLLDAAKDINQKQLAFRNSIIQKQTRAHRLLGWTL